MKFYEALEYLLTTSGSTKIARKSWGSNKYLTKGTITVGMNETKRTVPTIDIVEILGGEKYKNTFHANPEMMMSEDWYIVQGKE
jgi:hypothetical protein